MEVYIKVKDTELSKGMDKHIEVDEVNVDNDENKVILNRNGKENLKIKNEKKVKQLKKLEEEMKSKERKSMKTTTWASVELDKKEPKKFKKQYPNLYCLKDVEKLETEIKKIID
ncbi:MAG: hypothetical protein ACOCP8_03360 [archaeon]